VDVPQSFLLVIPAQAGIQFRRSSVVASSRPGSPAAGFRPPAGDAKL